MTNAEDTSVYLEYFYQTDTGPVCDKDLSATSSGSTVTLSILDCFHKNEMVMCSFGIYLDGDFLPVPSYSETLSFWATPGEKNMELVCAAKLIHALQGKLP